MKIHKFENNEDWLNARMGKITGSKDIVVKRGTGEKMGFYEILAEKIAIHEEVENPRERGNELEKEAIELFSKTYKKEVDTSLVLWERDDNKDIALSPDGFIGETEAVEIKCLSSANHIKAIVTNEPPEEYKYQILQYFIVNEKLEKLYFVMYDPRMPQKLQLKVFEIEKNEETQALIDEYLQYQRDKIEKINKLVLELTF